LNQTCAKVLPKFAWPSEWPSESQPEEIDRRRIDITRHFRLDKFRQPPIYNVRHQNCLVADARSQRVDEFIRRIFDRDPLTEEKVGVVVRTENTLPQPPEPLRLAKKPRPDVDRLGTMPR
jgi:hypothetical protein